MLDTRFIILLLSFYTTNFSNMKVAVLGLGETLSEYRPELFSFAIGVNDIWKYIQTPFIVCIDPPINFKEDRRKTIINSQPEYFFTHLDEWRGLQKNFKPIQCNSERGKVDLKDVRVPISNNSVFVACAIAFRLGADEIVIYGADFNTHHYLAKDVNFKTASEHFATLRNELNKYNVKLFIGAKASRLSRVLPLFKP